MDKLKVCFLTAIASKYKMDLWKEIANQYDVTILMMDAESTYRHDSFYASDVGQATIISLKEDYKKTIRKAVQECDVFVDSIYTTKMGLYAIHCCKQLKKPSVLIADGGLAIKRNAIMDKVIAHFMNKHNYFFSSGSITDQYFHYYGISDKRIYHYPFSSHHIQDFVHCKQLLSQKEALRKELGIPDTFMWLSVGRPIPRKGFDLLVEAFHKTGREDTMCCYIVGGQAEENVKQYIDENHVPNIHFIETIAQSELQKYYACADGFILPTRYDIWGLVINEAMAFGLPIITSDQCVAGLHFAKESKGITIVKNLDVEGYAKAMVTCMDRSEETKEKAKENLEVIQNHSIENSSQILIEAIAEVAKRGV